MNFDIRVTRLDLAHQIARKRHGLGYLHEVLFWVLQHDVDCRHPGILSDELISQ